MIECCGELSLADLRRSLCILPAAEKTRSTRADDAGAAKYCLTIRARLGHCTSRDCTHILVHKHTIMLAYCAY